MQVKLQRHRASQAGLLAEWSKLGEGEAPGGPEMYDVALGIVRRWPPVL